MSEIQIIEREAKLFEAGSYPDKDISITETDLDSLAQSFTEVPVKIEHVDTPLDGSLGALKSVWREGKELFGKIGFTPEAWTLIDKAGARKLSIGLKRDKTALTEVSLVKNPRIAGATVFDDRYELVGDVYMSWNGLTEREIRQQIENLIKSNSDKYYNYVIDLYEDSVVISKDGTNYKCDYAIVDGKVSLGEMKEAKQVWEEVEQTGFSNSNDDSNSNENTNVEVVIVAEPTKTQEVFTIDDVQKLVTEATAASETKFSSLLNEVKNENTSLKTTLKEQTVNAQIDTLKRAGKLIPACEGFAKAILMAGDSQVVTFGDEQTNVSALFAKFVETLPKIVDFNETGKGEAPKAIEFSAEQVEVFRKLGMSDEDIAKAMEVK